LEIYHAFEDAIKAEPTNPLHRLVYADWLEEEIGLGLNKVSQLREEARVLATVPSYTHLDVMGFYCSESRKICIALYIESNEKQWGLLEDGTMRAYINGHSPADAERYVKQGYWKKLS
jgi:hypothetical protein